MPLLTRRSRKEIDANSSRAGMKCQGKGVAVYRKSPAVWYPFNGSGPSAVVSEPGTLIGNWRIRGSINTHSIEFRDHQEIIRDVDCLDTAEMRLNFDTSVSFESQVPPGFLSPCLPFVVKHTEIARTST